MCGTQRTVVLVHKGCKGLVIEDRKRPPYVYERDDGTREYHFALVCVKCRVEILGDDMLEDV